MVVGLTRLAAVGQHIDRRFSGRLMKGGVTGHGLETGGLVARSKDDVQTCTTVS